MPDVLSNELSSTTSVTVDMLSFSVGKYVQFCVFNECVLLYCCLESSQGVLHHINCQGCEALRTAGRKEEVVWVYCWRGKESQLLHSALLDQRG